MKEKLALMGGKPLIDKKFDDYKSIGSDEYEYVKRAFDNQSLSGFYGSWGDEFLGGELVKEFETNWSKKFQSRYTISVNSATSGLHIALAAAGISPGDEVIVSPYTMSASAVTPLLYGGIPRFVDIDPDYFYMSTNSIIKNINEKTKAIIVVNIFGHPAELKRLREICDAKKIVLIEDNAQAPLAKEYSKYAGTVGHIGIFSLNYHKHIHCGEGGMCVTDDKNLALKMQAVRNHAENIIEPAKIDTLVNMVGFNFRMTEMSAAVGLKQLEKIENEVDKRVSLSNSLSDIASSYDFLTPPKIREGCTHSFYVWAMKFNENEAGICRNRFSAALNAEGFPNFVGYVKPLYNLPTFQQKIAIGRDGWPFNLSDQSYNGVLCPTAEQMYSKELIAFETCAYEISDDQLDRIDAVFKKVTHNINDLKCENCS